MKELEPEHIKDKIEGDEDDMSRIFDEPEPDLNGGKDDSPYNSGLRGILMSYFTMETRICPGNHGQSMCKLFVIASIFPSSMRELPILVKLWFKQIWILNINISYAY